MRVRIGEGVLVIIGAEVWCKVAGWRRILVLLGGIGWVGVESGVVWGCGGRGGSPIGLRRVGGARAGRGLVFRWPAMG